jgi:hypothetical protein
MGASWSGDQFSVSLTRRSGGVQRQTIGTSNAGHRRLPVAARQRMPQ